MDSAGTDSIVREYEGLRVAAARVGAGVTVPVHQHDHAQMVITLAGSFATRFNGTTLCARPGDVLTCPPAVEHTHRFGPTGADLIVVEGRPLAFEAAPEGAFEAVDLQPVIGGVPLGRRIRREMAEDAPHSELAVKSLVFQIVVAAARGREGPLRHSDAPGWVAEARRRIEADYGTPLRINDLAEESGVSPMKMIRAFQRHFGVSPGAYLRQVRVEQALVLLESTDLPLACVALETGYSDQSHLCRVVKAETGLTPSQYRAESQV